MTHKSNHWTNYWQSGTLTSLPQDFVVNYDGEIGAFWNKVFQPLDESSAILDVCTGNGAIAILAAEFSLFQNRHFQIMGADAANIEKSNIERSHPNLQPALEQISFISDCLIEDLDLPKHSIDLITSQYGIEYCDWQRTAKKVKELLKPNGKLVFISHAPSTSIMAFMKVEQSQYDFLGSIGVFKILENYFAKKTSLGNTLKKLTATKIKLKLQITKSQSQLYTGVLQFLEHVTSLMPSQFKSESGRIESYYGQHLFAYQRLQDILNVSEKILLNKNWYLEFEKVGLKLIESGDIIQSGSHNAGKFYKFENR
jgi:ubiquinone/menaquinone biosynthesis C-methylase UbiE